nr:hypothetical protein PJ912_01550 [Pectobacterium colocasium]
MPIRQLALTATNDINLGSASSQEYLDMNSKVKGSGFLSKRTTTTRAGYDATLANGSSLGGKISLVSAGNNLNINGSDVAADWDWRCVPVMTSTSRRQKRAATAGR